MEKDSFDATLLANRSLCWLLDAQQCRMMSPRVAAFLGELKSYTNLIFLLYLFDKGWITCTTLIQ